MAVTPWSFSFCSWSTATATISRLSGAAVVKAGHTRQICLSHDCVCSLSSPRLPFAIPKDRRPTTLRAFTDNMKPMTHLLTDFLPRLKDRGVTAEEVEIILRDNPRRLLTGEA